MKNPGLAILLAALYAPAFAQDVAQPDARDAIALIRELNAEILASRSATLTLRQWCADHRLAEKAEIVARLMRGSDKPPSKEQLQRLQVANAGEVKYRRVELRCGGRVLSIADNWYVPARLTPEMNRLLETTETPFGTAVRPLDPYRETIAERLLWSPPAAPIPDALFEHRAVLYTRERVPFSEVHEVYQRGLLAFSTGEGPAR